MYKIVLGAGVLTLLFSVYTTITSNMNAGVLFIYCIAAVLLLFGLFGKDINRLCASGPFFVLRLLFFTGCGAYALLLCFIAFNAAGRAPNYTEQAVIVLGAGVHGSTVSPVLASRLNTAYAYHLQNPGAYIVVSGGQGPGEDITEALAMQRYLLALGVPESLILLEEASESTLQNFQLSKGLLAGVGIGTNAPVVFITNGFHTYRSAGYAAMCGFTNVYNLPAPTTLTALPTCYLREGLAVLSYWARSFGLYT